jgi:hypothetical protein
MDLLINFLTQPLPTTMGVDAHGAKIDVKTSNSWYICPCCDTLKACESWKIIFVE